MPMVYAMDESTYYVAPPKSYIYVRSNPIIDDSWIGTLVSFAKKPTRVTPITNPDEIDLNSANNLQVPTTNNPVWVQDWKQTQIIQLISGRTRIKILLF